MARGLGLVVAVLVAATLGSGCEGEDVDIDVLGTPTPGAQRTATPPGSTPVRTATAVPTATPAATATPAGPTSTAGGPTSTAGGPTATPTPGGAVDADVQAAVGDLLPFFTVAGLTTGVSSSSAAVQIGRGIGIATQAAVDVDDCPDGGTRTQDDQLATVTVTLAACKFSDPDLGSFQFDGSITASLLASSASFNVTAKDLDTDRTVTFTGSVSGTPASGGGFIVNGGPITIATPQGDFTLTLDALTVDGNGNVVSGGGTLNDDDDLFDLLKIELTVTNGGASADLDATFDDDSTASYVLDLKKGSITPAS
jgi:hypothetical protein